MSAVPALILASKSESRKGMLARAGVNFTSEASGVDEDVIKEQCRKAGKSADDTALALAHAKAEKIAARHKEALVLGADQMLECQGRWLDKARDMNEAKEQLRFLSGKTHELVTAAVLLRVNQTIWENVSRQRMVVRELSEKFIEEYCRSLGDKVLNSIGCYALEQQGAQLFESVEGDFFSVLGLPLLPLLKELRRQGVVPS